MKDLDTEGSSFLAAKGGKGGKGNHKNKMVEKMEQGELGEIKIYVIYHMMKLIVGINLKSDWRYRVGGIPECWEINIISSSI